MPDSIFYIFSWMEGTWILIYSLNHISTLYTCHKLRSLGSSLWGGDYRARDLFGSVLGVKNCGRNWRKQDWIWEEIDLQCRDFQYKSQLRFQSTVQRVLKLEWPFKVVLIWWKWETGLYIPMLISQWIQATLGRSWLWAKQISSAKAIHTTGGLQLKAFCWQSSGSWG